MPFFKKINGPAKKPLGLRLRCCTCWLFLQRLRRSPLGGVVFAVINVPLTDSEEKGNLTRAINKRGR